MKHERKIRAVSQLTLNLDTAPTKVKRKKVPPEVRFQKMLKVRPNGCIDFTGAENGCGSEYGRFRVDNDRIELAHRYAYSLVHGTPPELLRHTCNNPKCCNPAHIKPGTNQQNADDARASGRLRGNLKMEQVQLIVKLHDERGMSEATLSKRFKVSKIAIVSLLRGKTWSKVTGIKYVPMRKTTRISLAA